MRQPGMSIGVGLVTLGCAGLLFALLYLWMMPRSNLEAVVAAVETARKPALNEQRLPDPAAQTPGAAPLAPPAQAPALERSVSLAETPASAPADAAADAGMAAEAESMARTLPAAAPVAAPPADTAPVATASPLAAAPAARAPVLALSAAAQAKAPPAPTAPEATAPAPARPAKVAALAASANGYRLQLGAMRTPESAQQEWERLQHQHGDVLGKLAYAAPRVDLGSRGVFYRIQAGPIAAAADANRACNQLKQRGVSCLLVKP